MANLGIWPEGFVATPSEVPSDLETFQFQAGGARA